MTFFSVLVALIFEQFYSLSRNNPVYVFVRSAVDSAEKNLNTGLAKDGRLAWLLLVFPPVLLLGLGYYLLLQAHPILAFLLNIVIVYFTLGFRQFSHYFTDIHKALLIDDLVSARETLQNWTGRDTSEMNSQDVARLTLENAVIAVHRHVFGVFFCFLLPIGPVGVVIYRMAEYIARRWNQAEATDKQAFGLFAQQIFQKIDWLPARLTALGFAIVGNFEDAIQGWRHQKNKGQVTNENILMAAASGALGVNLNINAPEETNDLSLEQENISFAEIGESALVRVLQSAIGLVWRAMVLWMVLLALLSLAKLVG
jgi:adenosylcobinamide-phosphate synthase